MITVDIAFSILCYKDQSLHFKDAFDDDLRVTENFMSRITCKEDELVSQVLIRLGKEYPFLILNYATDPDGERADEFDTLEKVWHNYQSYEGVDCAISERDHVTLHVHGIYESLQDEDLTQFHALIRERPFSTNIMHELKRWNITDESYDIRFPNGEYHSLSGHSYDGLQGTDRMVDQLLTCQEKYVITNDATGEQVELSSQQCFVVSPYDKDGIYKPYFMVSRSGLKLLEKLGPIETLKVRIGHLEDPTVVKSEGNTSASIFQAYSDILGLFTDISRRDVPLDDSDRRSLHVIETEIIPLLDSLRADVDEPRGTVSNAEKSLVRKIWDFILGFFLVWIWNGLIFNLATVHFLFLLKAAFCIFVCYRLEIPKGVGYVGAIIIYISDTNVIQTWEKIGLRGGIPLVLKFHSLHKKTKEFLEQKFYNTLDILSWALVCYNRQIYNESGEVILDNRRLRENQGASFIMHIVEIIQQIVQDLILLVLTLFPPFSDSVKRVRVRAAAIVDSNANANPNGNGNGDVDNNGNGNGNGDADVLAPMVDNQ